MYQCPKCKGTLIPEDDTYTHKCTDTLQRIAAKVAEHKELQDDPDYQLAKAAFTVLRVLCPEYPDPAWTRAKFYLLNVDRWAYSAAHNATMHLTPRRRWQDKKENAGD